MPLFDLEDFELVELNSCDKDISDAFKKIGGGYYRKYPSLIQLNRHLERLNRNLEALLQQRKGSENCACDCERTQNNVKP